ncbi:MAG: beta-ketoacyl-[acyl-carrier-protein] synthase family protein, partial [Fimbriiglobus sp.]
MPTTTRRAVLTGLGLVSPVGSDPAAFWQALVGGTSGVGRVRSFDASSLPCHIAAEIPGFDAKKIVPKDVRKSLKVMARTVQLGVVAAQLAAESAKVTKGTFAPVRFGVEFGCVMVATELEDLSVAAKTSVPAPPGPVNMGTWGRTGLAQVPPLWMLKYLPNMPACHVSIQHDAQGPNNTVTAGDVAGLLALGEAYRIFGRNQADAFLVGGTDSRINPLSFTRFNLFQPLTRRNDDPTASPQPYALGRDGTVLGEAAAVFVMEDLASAVSRGAPIFAEMVGFASGFDRGRKGPVFAQVIRNAMNDAGISPADVDHVNGAAAGYPELDAFEARAIAEVFGTGTPVFAPRGHFG